MNQSFPLYRDNEINLEEICSTFNNLKKYNRDKFTSNNITKQKLDYFYGFIIVENSIMKKLSKLSDYFQEQNRIMARRKDQEKSPFEIWEENKHLEREDIRLNTKECTTFCCTISRCLIKELKSKKILDFCSGWGDRLIGAMTCDDRIKYYCGIDPNKKLHKGYSNMKKSFLEKGLHKKYEMIEGCAEDIIPTLKKTFDLIFTSPPYFDLEIYSDDKSQSINKYPKFEDWYNKFLVNSIKLSITKLEKYGYIAININNIPGYSIINPLIMDITSKNIKFLGIIYYGNHRAKSYIHQPILLWQKV